jgi:hypothetical protein
MSQRVAGFLVVLLLMFSGEILGQENIKGVATYLEKKDNFFIKSKTPQVKSFSHRFMVDSTNSASQKFIFLNPVPGSYHYSHLGFFCKQELQLEKTITLPLRFRLGSLDYVNYMEQKPNAVKPGR